MYEVIECRRILQWTYVLGYYMPSGPEKQLFEFLQENLEKNAEHLHGLVERPLDKVRGSLPAVLTLPRPRRLASTHPAAATQFANVDARDAFQRYRTDVTNFSNVTRKFRENLMVGVEGGLTEASSGIAGATASSGAAASS